MKLFRGPYLRLLNWLCFRGLCELPIDRAEDFEVKRLRLRLMSGVLARFRLFFDHRLWFARGAVIVIPTHTDAFSDSERRSLKRVQELYGESHDIVFAVPESLEPKGLLGLISGARIERFTDSCFQDAYAYNRLLITPEFYERFLDYRYLLLVQSDVYLFSDKLAEWTGKGFDYVGAPWMDSRRINLTNVRRFASKEFPHLKWLVEHHVGNGGFSLRKVHTFYSAAQRFWKHRLDRDVFDRPHLDKCGIEWNFIHEDLFWSFLVPLYFVPFRMPSYIEALDFGMETEGKRSVTLNQGRLPFGVHAWETVDADFWKPLVHKYQNDPSKEAT